jgi:threonine synthase
MTAATSVGDIRRQLSQSVVLRYGSALRGVSGKALAAASIREVGRILPLATVDGVHLDVLDLSTGSTTWTFKDWLACVAVARSWERGDTAILFQSSGNTGMALSVYASRLGILPLFLYPEGSRYKLDARLLNGTEAILFEVARSEPEIKRLTAVLAQALALPLVPDLDTQIEANKLRAYLLLDHYRHTGEWHQWHAQALSSAFGPLGLFWGIQELRPALGREKLTPPRLYGIQQEAVRPWAQLFQRRHDCRPPSDGDAAVVEPTLFRTQPGPDLVHRMGRLMATYGGSVTALSNADYQRLRPKAIALLAEAGLAFGISIREGRPVQAEQAGILALCGVLAGLEKTGVFRRGERVLVAITGGCRPDVLAQAVPDLRIGLGINDEEIIAQARELLTRRLAQPKTLAV